MISVGNAARVPGRLGALVQFLVPSQPVLPPSEAM